MQVEMICQNEGCPGHVWNEEGDDIEEEFRWWMKATQDRATGAYDTEGEECPECGDPGEPTGEVDYN